MVLTRAFACALPVVASDIPGYREVLDPAASVAVPPGDRAALVGRGLRARRRRAAAASSSGEAARGDRRRALLVAGGSRAGSRAIYEQVTGLERGAARAA